MGTRLRKAKSTILVITAVLFLSVNISVYGQSHNISFKYLNTDHGLSQSDIICMYKDSQGYMWFGTRDGLNRYDGYSFKVYRHNRKRQLKCLQQPHKYDCRRQKRQFMDWHNKRS